MFNEYMIRVIGKLEHEERERSLAPIPDFFEPMKASQPGWVSRPVVRMLQWVVHVVALVVFRR